ncbi:MAG: ABC transporter ATP-binding protein [Anaerolineaceae bacterium]|nr:ABC transporter ATP-binding protein [Anaerolineaceae bacterium]
MAPVITVDNLTRRFGETVAVNELSLVVEAGEVFGFLGHNGAGKTTTVRLLNGVLLTDSGTIQVLGHSPLTDGPAVRARTGVLTETPSLEERLTARENLAYYAALYDIPSSEVNPRINTVLETFDLSERADEKAGGYSKGMKQRLALARALFHQPELLFLDEPTASLDPVASRQVHEIITHLSQDEGRTVFLCTHNLDEAQRLCDRVAVMEHGRLLALGTPAELGAQLGGRARLEIEVAPGDTPQAADLLRSAGATEVRVEHDTLHVAGIHREAVPGILAALVAAGVAVYRLNPVEPSLEDIYFALHDNAEREGIA